MVADLLLNDQRQGPLDYLYFALKEFVSTQGDLLTWQEGRALLAQAGLQMLHAYSVAGLDTVLAGRTTLAFPEKLAYGAQQKRVQDQRDSLQRLLDEQMAQRRVVLRRLIGDAFFQEAIFLSNPDLYQNSLQAWLAAPDKDLAPAFERKMLAYLQRFCAKNDTASFFGPLNCGRIVDQRDALSIQRRGDKYTRREAFISFWVANRLAQLISTDPDLQRYLAPRIHPQCLWEGETVTFVLHAKQARLNRLQQGILRHTDGSRTVEAIAHTLAQLVEVISKEVEKLAAHRILICRLEIPSTIFHPLSYLLKLVEQIPDSWGRQSYWLQQLGELEQLRQHFVPAPLPQRQQLLAQIDEKYRQLTREAPRRGTGATYADRTPLFEECAGTFETFHFSRQFFAELQSRLQPVLDLSAAYGTLLWQHYQDCGKAVFKQLSPVCVNTEVTFTEMLPGPDDLWLVEDNQRFCCEFRMTAFRYGDDTTGHDSQA